MKEGRGGDGGWGRGYYGLGGRGKVCKVGHFGLEGKKKNHKPRLYCSLVLWSRGGCRKIRSGLRRYIVVKR